jgi:hypothetical protein
MKEKINISDYTYISGQNATIKGEILIAMLNLLQELKERETQEVLLLSRPTKITKNEVIWTGTKPAEFFSQQPVKGLTHIGAKCLDLEFVLSIVHEENIQLGNATHKSDLIKRVDETDKGTTDSKQ